MHRLVYTCSYFEYNTKPGLYSYFVKYNVSEATDVNGHLGIKLVYQNVCHHVFFLYFLCGTPKLVIFSLV